MNELEDNSERYQDISDKVKVFFENNQFLPGEEAAKELPTDYLKLGIFLSASVVNVMDDLKLTPENAHENGHFILIVSSIIAKAIDEAVKYEKVAA